MQQQPPHRKWNEMKIRGEKKRNRFRRNKKERKNPQTNTVIKSNCSHTSYSKWWQILSVNNAHRWMLALIVGFYGLHLVHPIHNGHVQNRAVLTRWIKPKKHQQRRHGMDLNDGIYIPQVPHRTDNLLWFVFAGRWIPRPRQTTWHCSQCDLRARGCNQNQKTPSTKW